MSRLRLVSRAVLIVLAVGGAGLTPIAERPAHASVSIAVSWEGLLDQSSAAAVLTALDATAVWEGGRIYTYTRMRVEQVLAGEMTAGGEAWIRTMGGIVGDIGQQVEGEAVLSPGQASLLFLHPGPAGTFEVTARAQGQFPVVAGDASSPAHVVRSRASGFLVSPRLPSPALPPRLAADVLHGRTLAEAKTAVASAWAATHAR
jgi:hypothetical protein